MARVFSIDVLACPRCKSRMQQISFVQDPSAINGILQSLNMTTGPPDVFEPDERVIEYDSHQAEYPEDEIPRVPDF